MENDSLMTVGEVASRLRVKVSWIYSHADDLGAFRLGKYLRFSWPRVLECLNHKGSLPGLRHDLPAPASARILDRTAWGDNGNKPIA